MRNLFLVLLQMIYYILTPWKMCFILSVLSLSAVLRLGTDSLVLLMNALKRKGKVWVGKKYIQNETWWLAKERTPEKGISGAVFILQRFARSIEWHYLFRLISLYTWEVRPLRIGGLLGLAWCGLAIVPLLTPSDIFILLAKWQDRLSLTWSSIHRSVWFP